MCKSNCQGTCFLSLKNTAIDSKESLIEMIDTLNKMRGCSSSGKLNNKAGDTNSVDEITDLNKAAGELIADIDHTIAGNEDDIHSSGTPDKIQAGQNFKERLIAIKNAISLLETAVLQQ